MFSLAIEKNDQRYRWNREIKKGKGKGKEFGMQWEPKEIQIRSTTKWKCKSNWAQIKISEIIEQMKNDPSALLS